MNQRNVPGIDDAYLAMDTEEGVEVVWNEVMISERKNFKQLEVRPPQNSSWNKALTLLICSDDISNEDVIVPDFLDQI